MKSTLQRWLALALVALVLVAALPAAPARAARLVRIGYPDMNGFFYTDPDGYESGYIYDLMMECAQITDRDYSFVRMEADECYDMLKSGQVDLCVGVPFSVPHRDQLAYGNVSLLDAPLALVVQPDSPLGFEDYVHLTNGKVGVYAAGLSLQQLAATLSGRGASVELETYPSRQALLDALAAGEILAAVINTDLGITGLRIIATFTNRSFYCVGLAEGDQSLLEETDKALRELTLTKTTLLNELDVRYTLLDDHVQPSVTLDELKYINKGRVVQVVVPKGQMLDDKPIEPIQLLLNELSAKTGLKFLWVVRDSEADALATLRAGKADMMLYFDSDYSWAQEQNVKMSSDYLDSTYRIITQPGTTGIRSIAVARDSYIHYRMTKEDRYQLVPCASDEAAIQAVLDGQADAAVCWTPDAEQILYRLNNHELVYEDISSFGGPVCIAVSKMCSVRLLSLLNKAIACIRPQRLQTIAVAPVGDLYAAQQESASRRMNLLVMLIALVLLAAMGAGILLIRERLRLSSLKVKARNDYIRVLTNKIRRSSQTIQGVAAGGARINRADILTALDNTGEELGELAQEMEVMSQLDDHTYAITPVPVRPEDVFQRLTDYVSQRSSVRGVRLNVRTPKEECPVVMLDEDAYRRVCLIMIDNVLSRVESGGEIELLFDLERMREKKNQWTIVTSFGDNGAMLSRQFVRRISEQPRRDSEHVLGLRLMTAKRVVQAMGGEMGVRQRPNAGMRMAVRLPVEQAEPLQMMSLSRGAYGGKGLLDGLNILLAEENPITAQLLYSLLVNEGAHVDLVDNGQQVLDRFLDSPPAFYQAILADLHLPGMTGAEAAQAIRDLPRRDCSSVFIVGMQSGAQTVDPAAARALSIILPKPLNTATLCRSLHQWVASGRS